MIAVDTHRGAPTPADVLKPIPQIMEGPAVLPSLAVTEESAILQSPTVTEEQSDPGTGIDDIMAHHPKHSGTAAPGEAPEVERQEGDSEHETLQAPAGDEPATREPSATEAGMDQMREAQEADTDVSRLASWIQANRKPDPKDMDAENQQVHAMVVRWKELHTLEEVMYWRCQHGL